MIAQEFGGAIWVNARRRKFGCDAEVFELQKKATGLPLIFFKIIVLFRNAGVLNY